MPWDKNAAVTHADSHARRHSTGNCARYVREAIDAGGVVLGHTHYAKNYGPVLAASGFQPIHGVPQKGDVVVIQPAPGHPPGTWPFSTGRTGSPTSSSCTAFIPAPRTEVPDRRTLSIATREVRSEQASIRGVRRMADAGGDLAADARAGCRQGQ